MERAFTLIELLVVIAIIAILAGILFPVFALAKAQAKKASDLSNTKQNSLAVLQYELDTDDLLPLECGQQAGTGLWTWQYRLLTPPNWSIAPPTDARVQGSYGLVNNTIQPYAKSYAIQLSPVGWTDMGPLDPNIYAPAGGEPPKITYTYNGLLTAFNETAIPSVTTVPVWTADYGANAGVGWASADPVLICNNPGQACVYTPCPDTGPSGANGTTGTLLGTTLSWWLFANGQNWSYADGHAKFRKVGNTPEPAFSNWLVEPWVNYTSTGIPGGYYWGDPNGCSFPFLYRPDYIPPNGFN